MKEGKQFVMVYSTSPKSEQTAMNGKKEKMFMIHKTHMHTNTAWTERKQTPGKKKNKSL
jgi:hypothetical protein